MEASGLTPEQRDHVLNSAVGGLIDVLNNHPELAKLPTGAIQAVYLAGLNAGVDALDRVLEVGLRDWPGGGA